MTQHSTYNARHSKSVLIIGGGIAGLAAALPLVEEGFRVTLYEKRGLLGGRASSFVDQETGERIDNCQHVTMRCCTNLEDFYTRLGVADKIRYSDTLTFLDRRGRTSRIYGSPLPAPLHTLPSFLRFRALGLRDKLAVARGLLAILRARPEPKYEQMTMADWLTQMRQTPTAMERFWRTILVSACNEDLDRIACSTAFMIFRDGFLIHPRAYHVGLPTVRLADLYTEPAVRFIERHGGAAHQKTHIDAIRVRAGRVDGVTLADGSTVKADYYVSAVPFDLLLKMLPAEVVDAEPYFANLKHLEYSPITGVHLWFDRPLDAPEAVALLDREMQWIFNKTKTYGVIGSSGDGVVGLPIAQSPDSPVTYLGLVVSSAKRLAEMPREEIVRLALEDVYECVPGAREANLVKAHVIKERKATFAPLPGSERWRPDQRSPLSNLFVAGDWTATNWPATMEGAVRSGYRAAEYLFAEEEIKRRVLVPDLPATGLARFLFPRRA